MSDGLKPMLLMVCGPCAAGDFTAEPGDSDCAFCNAIYGAGMPPEPARTREEMVEAAAEGVRGDHGHGHGNSWEAAPEWRKQPYRETAERALIAAGVIEPEDSQASGEHRTL